VEGLADRRFDLRGQLRLHVVEFQIPVACHDLIESGFVDLDRTVGPQRAGKSKEDPLLLGVHGNPLQLQGILDRLSQVARPPERGVGVVVGLGRVPGPALSLQDVAVQHAAGVHETHHVLVVEVISRDQEGLVAQAGDSAVAGRGHVSGQVQAAEATPLQVEDVELPVVGVRHQHPVLAQVDGSRGAQVHQDSFVAAHVLGGVGLDGQGSSRDQGHEDPGEEQGRASHGWTLRWG